MSRRRPSGTVPRVLEAAMATRTIEVDIPPGSKAKVR
jgi:hypothetical protein